MTAWQSDLAAATNRAAREAARLRLSALEQITDAGFGHLGSCMSCADLIAAAFSVFEFGRRGADASEYFILSKGHAAPILYAAMAPEVDRIPYAIAGSSFPGHPNGALTPGVVASSGSVGMGLAIGIGLAMGLELTRRQGKVVVLAGDGELQAGMVWEAMLNLSLRPTLPLLMLIDANGYQGGMAVPTGGVTRQMLEAAAPEFRAIEGNDVAEVMALMCDFAETPRCMVVWARTRRGAGVTLLEQNPLPMAWRPRDEDLDDIRHELRNGKA